MMSQDKVDKRKKLEVVSIEDLVPEDHLLRLIDKAINFDFIYDLVYDKYSHTTGRNSIDPVQLIKIPLIQYMYGIKSMRQTIKEIQVNMAYRWFLGLDMQDPVPHFTTFGKNYSRRFKDTDIFEQIFQKILEQCFRFGFVDPSVMYVDATHIKASANKKKISKHASLKEAKAFEELLKKEVTSDRVAHGKKPLKEKKEDDDDHKPSSGGLDNEKYHQVTLSETDPESGLFHKGEHKREFAYVSQTACDKNGWILDYTIHPGNRHDSQTFPILYEKLKRLKPKTIVADAGYKTPTLAKMMIDDNITPILPYTRPKGKQGLFKKKEFIYDEYFDCYICPNNQILSYSTTNREGYKEYKSQSKLCNSCPHLNVCTKSKNHTKIITRHVWQEYLETCEDIRSHLENIELYKHRKETIERIFGTAKEHHAMRYTSCKGKGQMEMKVGLTFACMNMKKLAKMLNRKGLIGPKTSSNLETKKQKFMSFVKKAGMRGFLKPALSSL